MKEEKKSLILPVHGVVIAFFPLDRSDGYTVKEAPCRNLKSIKWSLRCIDTGIGRPMYTTLHLGNKWDDAKITIVSLRLFEKVIAITILRLL